MTDTEQVYLLLNRLKYCAFADIGKYFSQATSLYRFLPQADKDACANNFYIWTEEHKSQHPRRFYYAEFLKALNYFMSEDFETSLQLLTNSRTGFREENDDEGLALCSMLIGAIYRTWGNFDLALKTLHEGNELLKRSGNYPVFIAANANSIANINLDLHNYAEAESMFKIAYDQSAKVNDYYFNIYALHGLGKVNMIQNRNEDARYYFERALEQAEKRNSDMHIANSITELANFYFKLENYSECEKLNMQALQIREQKNYISASVTNCIHLGECYIKQKKWNEALDILNKGLTKAEQTKIKPKIYRIYFLLSEIYAAQQNLELSFQHFKKYHSIKEQVELEDSVRKLTDAKLIFEAEQTKKENIIIKKQKEEIQQKNIELQKTIDELTLTRVSRKARTLTLIVAIVLFVIQDFMLGFVLTHLPGNNYFLSLIVKMVIIFSLGPINQAIEKYLLKKIIKNKNQVQPVVVKNT